MSLAGAALGIPAGSEAGGVGRFPAASGGSGESWPEPSLHDVLPNHVERKSGVSDAPSDILQQVSETAGPVASSSHRVDERDARLLIEFTPQEALLQFCRVDFHAFAEFVIKDEETNEYIEQAPIHVRMAQEYEAHRNLVIMAHPESGKTNQIAIARVLFNIGKNVRHRVGLVGNTQGGAAKTVSSIADYIEKSDRYRAVFPHVVPGDTWSKVALKVKRDVISKDYTVQAIGYHGDIIGSRLDEVVADDLLDHENTRTEEQRKETKIWWRRGIMTRVTGDGRVTFLANAWHLDDLAHELGRMGWRTLKFPVLNRFGKPTWPERWSMERIEHARRHIYGPLDFARILMCKTRDDTGVVFQDSWIDRCKRRGEGYQCIRMLEDVPDGCLLVVGVDLAASKVGITGARTCFFGILLHPDETRQVLFCDSGRYSAPEIISRLESISERFPDARIIVESNAAQAYIVEMTNHLGSTSIPTTPFYTGNNKYDPRYGFDAMSAEFEAGRWLIPSGRDGTDVNDEVSKWLGELETYDPTKHTGDRAMASWFARTWGMKKMRSLRNRGEGVGAYVIG